jgi:hypothetical protein
VDYGIVLEGEVWLELDDGKQVHLKPHDVVVQNGTRHAWRTKAISREDRIRPDRSKEDMTRRPLAGLRRREANDAQWRRRGLE